eukprot:1189635-Prorocentrum_minimum.AAC.3
MLRNVERVMSLGAQVRAKELDSLNEEMERSAAQRERSTMAEELTTLRSKVRPIHIYCMFSYKSLKCEKIKIFQDSSLDSQESRLVEYKVGETRDAIDPFFDMEGRDCSSPPLSSISGSDNGVGS